MPRRIPAFVSRAAMCGLLVGCRFSSTEIPAELPIRSIVGQTYALTAYDGRALPGTIPVRVDDSCAPATVSRIHIVFSASSPTSYQLRAWTNPDTMTTAPRTDIGPYQIAGPETIEIDLRPATVRNDSLRGTLQTPLFCATTPQSFIAIRISR